MAGWRRSCIAAAAGACRRFADELRIAHETLRRWNRLHDVDQGRAEGLTSVEREELRRLRRDVKRLEQERDLLKRAAALFAKETETR